MEDEFVNWDDLNLDDILGEDNWTDDEIVTSENDWESNSDEGTAATKTSSADKENETPTTTTSTGTASPAKKSTRKSTYKCPFCEKMYTSTSGFRGHVTKKHDRPDIKGSFIYFILLPRSLLKPRDHLLLYSCKRLQSEKRRGCRIRNHSRLSTSKIIFIAFYQSLQPTLHNSCMKL